MYKKAICYGVSLTGIAYVTSFIYTHVNGWCAAAFILGATIYVTDKIENYFANNE